MLHDEFVLVVIVLAAVVGWFLAQRIAPSALFVVRVRGGQPVAIQGKVTGSFLAVVAEVFQELDLPTGEIRGLARGRRITLWFSSDVPVGARQRLRNWWMLSGWPAKSGRR